MMNLKNFKRSKKGLSPIFATLILIAIAVIAGIVVYMFTSGYVSSMTTGGSAGTEKVAVQSAQYSSGGSVTILAQTVQGNPTFTGALLKDTTGNTVDSVTTVTGTPTTDGTLYPLTAALTAPSVGTYTVTLVTQAGGSFVSPAMVISTP